MVLEAVKVTFEEKLQKFEFDARVQSTLETSAEICFAASTERDIELQAAIVQEQIAKEETKALDVAML